MLTNPTPTERLVDEIRDLQARTHGKQIELCMALGDREGAQFHRREMYAICEARRGVAVANAERQGCCFFDVTGEIDSRAVEMAG